jgi:cyclopropane-fatty-acyl-phospholipid synthase
MNTSSSSPSTSDSTRHPGRRLGAMRAVAHWPLRWVLARLLRGVARGTLVVELPGGERLEGRGAAPGPRASLTLHRWRPLGRMLLHGDTALGETYRDGDWSSPDLAALLEFGIHNEAGWGRTLEASWPARIFARLLHLARANTRHGSRQNIAFHYDLGNDFYAHWLDADMLYSSALYRDGTESLGQAQAAKIARIVELLQLGGAAPAQPPSGATVAGPALQALPGDAPKILEIGCGWGALALALAGRHGARVTGLTLSAEQLAYAQARVAAQGLGDTVDLRLQDYRDVQGRYDRIVSIEMLEAVGERYWPVYFDTLRARLAPGGVAVVQVITIADAHFEHYRRSPDFIQRFIFPGGMLPSVSLMQAQAERAGLRLQQDESFGDSYATTLVEWRHRFLRAWPAIAPLGFDASFRRLWEYYLCYCEAGFRSRRVDVGLFTLRHAEEAPAAA